MDKFRALTQREKKYARTKVSILNSLLVELETKKFAEIFIKDLALQSEISEPTFFNYFSSKPDILVYFLQMWSIKMMAYSREFEKGGLNIKQTIQEIFKNTSEEISKTPQLMLEIIAYMAEGKNLPPHKITDAEKWLFFPDIKNIENIEELKSIGFHNILPPLIKKGIKNKEFSKDTDPELLFMTLVSLFFGTALLILPKIPDNYPFLLEKQIQKIL